MKEFYEKYKVVFLVVLIVFALISLGGAIYFFVLDRDGNSGDTIDTDVVETQFPSEDINDNENPGTDGNATEMPEYDERASSEAIEVTYEEAKKWSDDVELYNCTGVTTSAIFTDVTYEFIGADQGKYQRWVCTYYSPNREQTKIVSYVEGELDEDVEPVDIGEYGYLMYDNIDYPTDLDSIVDSTEIYELAIKQGLDINSNYLNMYLTNTGDYGFVWKLEERSKTEENEWGIGLLENAYIFDIYNGQLKDTVQEEIY